jgi:hypothetical protein
LERIGAMLAERLEARYETLVLYSLVGSRLVRRGLPPLGSPVLTGWRSRN